MTARPASLPRLGQGPPPDATSAVAVLEPRIGLARREAALAAWAVLAMLTLAYLAGESWRDDLTTGELAASSFALGGIVLGAASVMLRELGPATSSRGTVGRYAVMALVVTGAICTAAVRHDGLASPYLGALVLGSGYLGLMLPARTSAALSAMMTTALIPVGIFGPPATWLQVATLVVLVPTARLFGLLCGAAHRRAERGARRLTRADRLTGTLSRQGLLEELAGTLSALRRAPAPVALFLIDLDSFKQINAARGSAGGDELLAWCGRRLAEILPAGMSAGRLGGDEFGVAASGLTRRDADAFAITLHDALSERHQVSIGYATSEDGTVSVSDLLRVANAALQRSKQETGGRLHGLVAGGVREAAERDHAPAPVLTYDRLRQFGGIPPQPAMQDVLGNYLARALGGVALVGALVTLSIALTPVAPPSGWREVVTVGGAPWFAAALLTCLAARVANPTNPRHAFAMLVAATVLVGGGIGLAAMAQGGGLTEPIMGAVALRILFDTSVVSRGQAWLTSCGTLGIVIAMAAVSPASTLWALPLQLLLLASAVVLGRVAQRGFAATTGQWLAVARTDVLTGLPNRLGVEEDLGEVLRVAAARGERIAVVAVDIDGMRAYNDQHGHPAGDIAIQGAACRLVGALDGVRASGRLGADEFVVAVAVGLPSEADALATTVEQALRPELPGTAGVAVFPEHARDLDGLLRVADLRRRATRATRREAAGAALRRAA